MPFKLFKGLFQKATVESLCATKNNYVILKTYNNSHIEQLGICSVWLKHKDNVVRCRFFVVPGNGPALLGMLDTELLELLKIMSKVLNQQQVGRKVNSQTKEISGAS